MRFNKEGLSGSYDEKNDILYIYYKGRDYSYGSKDSEGIVTLRSIADDRLTGYLVYGFEDRVKREALDTTRFDLVFKVAIDKIIKEL